MNPALPQTHDVVLVGGGHTHALVLRKWGMRPLPGARMTLINPGPTAPYSGMLPGFVAGHYGRDDLDIDLVRLARFAGARIVIGAAEHIDTAARLVHVPDRPPIAFDLCSVDIGITSDMPALPGFADHAVPAKPLGTFAERWDRFANGSAPAHVVVIGGGVAGAELAMAIAYRLRGQPRDATVTLIERDRILTAIGARARQHIIRQMQALGIEVLEQAEIDRIHADAVVLRDGRRLRSGFTTGAAGARAHGWLRRSGLRLHEGFITVNDRLQSSDPAIFATGDCAHMTGTPRPKAGVFAVRQAPVLYDNICAALSGGDLRRYPAQKDYLKLISLGRQSALAERFGQSWTGPVMWRWKDHIDRAFMNRFRDLPRMGAPDLPPVHTTGMRQALGDKPLCGGCGAKVGRSTLRHALAPLAGNRRADVTPLPGDDAALLTTGGVQQVMTSDHLRALIDDPVLMTRIAANHALGDIWAMAATPQAATATVILPRLSDTLQQRMLTEIMATATAAIRDAGAEIVGGHSSVGAELTIGFTLTGLCDTPPVTLAGGQPGDALILTKPLGSGVLMAADMAGAAQGGWVMAALNHMIRSQSRASRILQEAHAMTDVTGFGLAGHLHGICEASGTGATLALDAIPVMDGALAMAGAGIRSSLYNDNRALVPHLPEGGKSDLLHDPQTAGGLLAAVAADRAEHLIAALRKAGYPAARIGVLTRDAGYIGLAPG
ncbi:selenide, water dikinase SelD [Microbulbifer sp. S227A]|uniref:selenide, water dikinase SelD n=1 Tax=Microbulbifer sp. S227A TaxID=3415131 RepID=UPI003C7BA0F0